MLFDYLKQRQRVTGVVVSLVINPSILVTVLKHVVRISLSPQLVVVRGVVEEVAGGAEGGGG